MMGDDLEDVEDVPAEALRRWRENREKALAEAHRILDAQQWAQWIVRMAEKRCCYCGMEGHLSKDCPRPRKEGVE